MTMKFFGIFLIFTHVVLIVKSDVTCQKIVGYYEGGYGNTGRFPTNFLFAQLEFELEARLSDRLIHLVTTHYNDSYAPGNSTYFHFYGNGFFPYCNGVPDCTAPFATNDQSSFTIHIHNGNDLPPPGDHYYPILYFNHFPNSFTLNNPVGRCTKSQLDATQGTDLTQFKYCICCDNYYPDLELDCPDNPWHLRSKCCCVIKNFS